MKRVIQPNWVIFTDLFRWLAWHVGIGAWGFFRIVDDFVCTWHVSVVGLPCMMICSRVQCLVSVYETMVGWRDRDGTVQIERWDRDSRMLSESAIATIFLYYLPLP